MTAIVIDYELIEHPKVLGGGYLPNLDSGKRDWYVAENTESAGEAARKYWQEIAENDPKEFAAIIGTERLIQWAMGQSDSYGFRSLRDFLDAVEGVPEEEFASYDSNELDVTAMSDYLDIHLELQGRSYVCESDGPRCYHRWDEDADDEHPGNCPSCGSRDIRREDIGDREYGGRYAGEAKRLWDGWQELIEKLGFEPTVAYRHN